MSSTAEVVICGAGICGIATAYQLAVTYGVKQIVIVDERPPLSLTSDKSSEAYRNWWPDEMMVRLMNRSIDWLEQWAHESGNRFRLNRRGYLYLTASTAGASHFRHAAEAAARAGAGEVRVDADRAGATTYAPLDPQRFDEQPDGADLLLDRALILDRFPGLNPNVVAALHARRCGWFSGQQLGMFLLEKAREQGVTLINDRIDRVRVKANRVEEIHLASDRSISTRSFVNAAGPFVQTVGQLIDVELPVIHERHLKIAFKDYLGVVPRDAPLMIWTDPQHLPWTADERAELAASEDTRWLLAELPGGAHLRPEGGADSDIVLMLWAYHVEPCEPIVPLPLDEFFPEVVLRGLSTMLPGLRAYFGKASVLLYDGGYYTRTPENRPLAGPLPVTGAYLCSAVSGYGLMASAAVGELVAAHITGGTLPEYAAAFSLERYNDPAYRRWLENWQPTGQL
ncbi:MAG TPA: FAD-binding oxidoreductase [Anaerolineae bacterium]|nr:FAD-binding oxidoreductase [Anaerolineae bacterium]